jgi:hypothetical protein
MSDAANKRAHPNIVQMLLHTASTVNTKHNHIKRNLLSCKPRTAHFASSFPS